MKTFLLNLLTLTIIALAATLGWTAVASAQPADLCGREETRGTLRVLVTCPDYPAIRKLTGSTMFPDEKGQQIFVRSTDPTTKAFRIAMTYRKDGQIDTVVKYSDVHEAYDSGAGWVLGDVQIVAVEVTELRESSKAEIR